MMKPRRMLVALFAASGLLGGCTDLADIDAGTCGNGVLEAGEDCDQSGGGCIQPGESFQCRFECKTDADCTSGWRCGADQVCREPTGSFQLGDYLPADNQIDLGVAEVNGAAPADLVTISASGELVVRFGGSGLSDVARFQTRGARPATGQLTKEANADIVHISDFAIGVLLGSPQKTLRPVAYAPIPIEQGESRFVVLEGKLPDVSKGENDPKTALEIRNYLFDDIVVLAGDKIVDALSQELNPNIATMPFDSATLIGGVPVGNVDEGAASPCDEMVLAPFLGSQVYVFSPCKQGGVSWNDDFAALPPVTLPGATTVGGGVLLADFDGDGHLDLLIGGALPGPPGEGAEALALVAYGAGDGTFNSTSPAVPGATDGKAALTTLLLPNMPLAAGDINGDGRADLVLPHAFVMSVPGCNQLSKACYDAYPILLGGLIAARVEDFNGNGLPDVVAISGQVRSVFFFNGTGSNVTNLFVVPTVGLPTTLASGDFDGDLVRDVAIAESQGGIIGVGGTATKGGDVGVVPDPSDGDVLSVLFGKLQGAPEPPVRMGELGWVEGILTGNLAVQGFDKMSDIGVLSTDQFGARAVALFAGASNRQLQSPFQLTDSGGEPDLPVAVGVGQFTSDDHLDIAALAVTLGGETRLWLVPSTGTAALSTGTTKVLTLGAGSDVAPCSASLVRMDLDADGRDELLVIGEAAGANAQGARIVVARASSNEGVDSFSLDPPIDFPELKLTNHPLPRSLCRAYLTGEDVEEAEGRLGRVEVGNVDATGGQDLVVMTFVATGEGEQQTLTSRLLVFPDGKLDAGSALDIALPSDVNPVTFTLLYADKDPELELAYFAPQGTFVADLDLAAKKLTNLVTLDQPFFGAEPATAPGFDFPINPVAGDFDGDGIPDVAMGYLSGTQLFYGVPVRK